MGSASDAFFNQANVLQTLGRLEEAIAGYDQAIRIKPDLAEAYANRGVALVALTRLPEALASFDNAIALKSDYAEAYFGRAVTRLMGGDLARGFLDFEWRWKRTHGPRGLLHREFSQPLWLGDPPIAGKSLLVYSEIGLGDTLQFCRYATLLSTLQVAVVLQVQSPLVELLAQLDGVARIVAEGQPLPAFDFHCPLLSLPLACKTQLDTIPAPRKYLSGNPARVAQWRARLGNERLRVGLVWRGDPNNPDDTHRSIPLNDMLQQLPLDVRYISLQKDLSEEERQLVHANPALVCLADELNFTEAAAVCECMDLVISVDTSVAHLSAALGKPTWVLLPFSPDCRWLLNRKDSPWYPTVTLYRQGSIGDWRDPLARVAADLKKQRGASVD
jgi:hypothetical protein